MSFYDVSSHTFWPKTKVAPNAAEEVRIVTDDGSVLASYSIKDFIAETGKSLSTGRPPGERPLPAEAS